MPQPLRDSNAKYEIGPQYLAARPHLAALVAEIIGRWSSIERSLGLLLSLLVDTAPHVAMEMYLAIKNQRAQKDALDKAAEAALTPDLYRLYLAVRMLARSCEKERDPLAHQLFGILPDDPDVLLLVSPGYELRLHARFFACDADIRAGVKPRISARGYEHQYIMVYRETDLRGIINRMARVNDHISSLFALLRPENRGDAQRYQSLCSEPDIAEVLSRLPASSKIAP